HFVAGGGWTTDAVLLNPTDDVIRGTLQLLSHDGHSTITSYDIAPRSSRKLGINDPNAADEADGAGSVGTGSFAVIPDSGQAAPSVATLYTHTSGGVTSSTSSAAATAAANQFNIYTQMEGTFGAPASIQTGVAIANPSSDPAEVEYELVALDGAST